MSWMFSLVIIAMFIAFLFYAIDIMTKIQNDVKYMKSQMQK